MAYENEQPKVEYSKEGFFGECWVNVERHELHKCKECLHLNCPYHSGNGYFGNKIPVIQLICAILIGIYAIVFIAGFFNRCYGRGGEVGYVLGEFIMPLILICIVILLISDIRRIIDKKVDRDFELKKRAKEKLTNN